MSLTFNGTDVQSASFNGTSLTRIYYQPKDGACTLVWQKGCPLEIKTVYYCDARLVCSAFTYHDLWCSPYPRSYDHELGPNWYCKSGETLSLCVAEGNRWWSSTWGYYCVCSELAVDVSVTATACVDTYSMKVIYTDSSCDFTVDFTNISGGCADHTTTFSVDAGCSCIAGSSSDAFYEWKSIQSPVVTCYNIGSPKGFCSGVTSYCIQYDVCVTADGRTTHHIVSDQDMRNGVTLMV